MVLEKNNDGLANFGKSQARVTESQTYKKNEAYL